MGFCVRTGGRKGDKWMFFRVMMFVWQFMLDLVAVMRMTDDEKGSSPTNAGHNCLQKLKAAKVEKTSHSGRLTACYRAEPEEAHDANP